MKIKGIEIYNTLSQIPDLDYEGYLWMSDSEYPIPAKDFDFNSVELNPFIQEALLFCKEENTSVMIRHAGEYHISVYNLNQMPETKVLENKSYRSHRLTDIIPEANRLHFVQLWLPENDKNCEGMEVLSLKAHVFTGFSKLKKD